MQDIFSTFRVLKLQIPFKFFKAVQPLKIELISVTELVSKSFKLRIVLSDEQFRNIFDIFLTPALISEFAFIYIISLHPANI